MIDVRAIALGVALAALPAVADAACAWVLWLESGPVSGEKSLTLAAAFSSGEQACEAAVERYLGNLKQTDSEKVKVTLTGRGAHIVHADRPTVERISLTCLPDTIDPRGPKGGR